MRLDAFMLADHAQAAEGKLYINGGGITRLNVPIIPFAIPSLTVIVRYVVENSDDYGDHELGLRLVTPSGVDLFPEESLGNARVEPVPGAAEGEEHVLQLCLSFGGVPIIEQGIHELSTILDGELTRRMTLPVVLLDAGAGTVGAPAGNRAERRRQERAAQKGRRR